MEQNAAIYEEIMLLINDAIDSEVGERRIYKDSTDLYVEMVSEKLKSALQLPKDFSL